MNKLILIVLALVYSNVNAQDFTISKKDHPYFDVIEWKGKGGLLRSRSEKEFMNQIGLALVSEKEEGMWDQKFNPKVREPFFIAEDSSKCVYFLDNFDFVNNGRITFNQINGGGNAKGITVDVGIKMKRMGYYLYDKFQFVDAVVTNKAFVCQYRFLNKKEKSVHDFAVIIPHHNFIPVIVELGEIRMDEYKDGKYGNWTFTGSMNDDIYFSWREKKTDYHGWTIKAYSIKGELTEDIFFKAPENTGSFTNIGYGTRGRYYQKDEDRYVIETGAPCLINDTWYLATIREKGAARELVLFEQDGDKWKELQVSNIKFYNPELPINLGVFPIKEGITYHLAHGESDKVGFMYFDPSKKGRQEKYTEEGIYNPSRFLFTKTKGEFKVGLPSKLLVCKTYQFAFKGGVSFEHRAY
ncbi:MAG: hypothetical protein MK066_07835 [Crocinitomicaceae bacterium]|nr:hypothetical protein [Crocinitomicaceae bacterium]